MTIEPSDVAELDNDATALILNIMEMNAKQSAHISTELMNGFKADAIKARAELNAVRWRIQHLFADGFQPSESAIIRALWPSAEVIEDFIEEEH